MFLIEERTKNSEETLTKLYRTSMRWTDLRHIYYVAGRGSLHPTLLLTSRGLKLEHQGFGNARSGIAVTLQSSKEPHQTEMHIMKPFAIIPVIALGILFQAKVRDFISDRISMSSEVTIIRNGFVADFALALHAPANFTPFVLRDGTLHCHPNFFNYSLWPSYTPRIPIFIDMIRATLDACLFADLPGCDAALDRERRWPGGMPMMLYHRDQHECDIMKRSDSYPYPRFSWNIPATKYGDDWCNAISVPTYINWKAFRDMDPSKWDAKIKTNERKYPWYSKIDRAVWRGSTTYHPDMYGGSELNEIPRGKLVQLSMKRPELIDAAFVNFRHDYTGKKDELRNQTIIAPRRMPFDEQMKYKAIIDIDGNSWSGRFASLLCTNSVVIKVWALVFFLYVNSWNDICPPVITRRALYFLDRSRSH